MSNIRKLPFKFNKFNKIWKILLKGYNNLMNKFNRSKIIKILSLILYNKVCQVKKLINP